MSMISEMVIYFHWKLIGNSTDTQFWVCTVFQSCKLDPDKQMSTAYSCMLNGWFIDFGTIVCQCVYIVVLWLLLHSFKIEANKTCRILIFARFSGNFALERGHHQIGWHAQMEPFTCERLLQKPHKYQEINDCMNNEFGKLWSGLTPQFSRFFSKFNF